MRCVEVRKKKYFGRHRFFLSYRNDLDLSQSLIDLLLESAREAVQDMEEKSSSICEGPLGGPRGGALDSHPR